MEGNYQNIIDFVSNFGIGEDEILYNLFRETALTQVNNNQMSSDKYQGHLLSLLIKISNSKKILEIGTFAGYSTIYMARTLDDDGKIYTIEKNDEIEWLSKKYFTKAKLEHKIESYIGNALEIIPKIDETFDFIFIDGDKREYLQYYKLCLQKLKKGGLIVADNVLWYGKIFSESDKDNMTKGIKNFIEFIEKDVRIEKIILPIRDGIMIIKKV
ncbi:MAG: O-methyltransferase [Bacteroidales bacterium]|jgi:predicted O-methyltransferase YrrM|nr:O-methyltransferase [Bacteroidales bacterium]